MVTINCDKITQSQSDETYYTYTTICSTPIPIILPMIAPTAMLGINNPDGILKDKQK